MKWLTSIRVQKEEADGFYMQTAYRMPIEKVEPTPTVLSTDTFGDIADGNVGEFVKFLPGVSLGFSGGHASWSGGRRSWSTPSSGPTCTKPSAAPSAASRICVSRARCNCVQAR